MKRVMTFKGKPTRAIRLHWRIPDDMTMHSTRAVYLMRKPGTRTIQYIGKAYRQSLLKRWECGSKDKWAGQKGPHYAPLVSGLFTTRKITPELINDVERLLIFMVQPILNHKGKSSCRLHHRELTIHCAGAWPYPRTTFAYRDFLPHSLEFSAR